MAGVLHTAHGGLLTAVAMANVNGEEQGLVEQKRAAEEQGNKKTFKRRLSNFIFYFLLGVHVVRLADDKGGHVAVRPVLHMHYCVER